MFELVPHPASTPIGVAGVAARIIGLDAHWLTIRWRVDGVAALVVPPFAGRGRQDGLWQTTCFELFVKPEGEEGYAEFNLSPSERWAAYDFTRYREGMAERPMMRQPVCSPRRGGDVLIFDASLPVASLPSMPWRYGLAAVIDEAGGEKSFWAIAHGRDVPDFHDEACFAAHLAAPDRS